MKNPPLDKYPRLHRDGTISFWSYFRQEWVSRAIFVPAEEIERMHPLDQERVRKHLEQVAAS